MASSSSTPCFLSRNRHYCGFVAVPKEEVVVASQVVKKTYASVVDNEVVAYLPLPIDVEKLSRSCLKGNEVVITLNEEVYQSSIQDCKSNLIGKILFAKRSAPVTTDEVKTQVEAIWKPSDGWRMVSLGKGFFDLHFGSIDEMHRVQSRGSWQLPCGLFRVMPWQADFNPHAPKSSHTQVWIRISHVSQEYWHPMLLMEIARGVGTPLQLDYATRMRRYGHFARVLADVDLASTLPSTLWVERRDHGFHVDISYEKLPDFCSHYRTIGHLVANCRSVRRNSDCEDLVSRKTCTNRRAQNDENVKGHGRGLIESLNNISVPVENTTPASHYAEQQEDDKNDDKDKDFSVGHSVSDVNIDVVDSQGPSLVAQDTVATKDNIGGCLDVSNSFDVLVEEDTVVQALPPQAVESSIAQGPHKSLQISSSLIDFGQVSKQRSHGGEVSPPNFMGSNLVSSGAAKSQLCKDQGVVDPCSSKATNASGALIPQAAHALEMGAAIVDNEGFCLVSYKNHKKKLKKQHQEMQSQSKFDQEEILLLDQVIFDDPKRINCRPKRDIRKPARFE